jgi:hypothetical protein
MIKKEDEEEEEEETTVWSLHDARSPPLELSRRVVDESHE